MSPKQSIQAILSQSETKDTLSLGRAKAVGTSTRMGAASFFTFTALFFEVFGRARFFTSDFCLVTLGLLFFEELVGRSLLSEPRTWVDVAAGPIELLGAGLSGVCPESKKALRIAIVTVTTNSFSFVCAYSSAGWILTYFLTSISLLLLPPGDQTSILRRSITIAEPGSPGSPSPTSAIISLSPKRDKGRPTAEGRTASVRV